MWIHAKTEVYKLKPLSFQYTFPLELIQPKRWWTLFRRKRSTRLQDWGTAQYGPANWTIWAAASRSPNSLAVVQIVCPLPCDFILQMEWIQSASICWRWSGAKFNSSLLQQAFARHERLDELSGTNTESVQDDNEKPTVHAHAMSANGRPTECPYFKKGSYRKGAGDLCNMSHTGPPAAKSKNNFKEKALICKEEGCGEEFKFSIEEQLSFDNRGHCRHSTDPSKCPKHRSKPFGHCDAFKDTGTYKFGDACRFVHTAQSWLISKLA